MKRRLFLALLTAVFLCTAALAAEPEAPILLTQLMEIDSPQKQAMLFLPVNGDPAALTPPDCLSCDTNAEAEYGGTLVYDCPVVWDAASLDVTAPGRASLTGQLTPEAGYALSPEFDGVVTHPVLLTAPEMDKAPLEAVERDGEAFFLLPTEGDPAGLTIGDTRSVCYAGEGVYFPCPVDWDLTSVNPAAPGMYSVSGLPQLPEGIALPEGFGGLEAHVGVVSPDYVDLSAAYRDPANNNMVYFSWLYQPEDRSSMMLQVRRDNGPWEDTVPDEYGGNPYGAILWNGQGLNLSLTSLDLQVPYAFRILYGENQVSNIAEILITDHDFTMTVGGKGGDRDGGDLPAPPLPDYEQPAPDPVEPERPSEPDPLPERPVEPEEPPQIWEINAQDFTLLSGVRLRQLTQAADTVLFEKHGVAVELDSAFLSGLSLEDWDLLLVEIRQPEPHTFTLAVQAGDAALAELPPTRVQLPCTEEAGDLLCCLPDGTVLSEADYHPETGTASCVITQTGSYQITSKPGETVPEAKPLVAVTPEPPAPAPEPVPKVPKSPEPLPVEHPEPLSVPKTADPAPAPEEPTSHSVFLIPALLLLPAGAVLLGKRWRHG